MDIGILADYLVVGVVAFCLAVGYVIKHSLQFIPNKYIPVSYTHLTLPTIA